MSAATFRVALLSFIVSKGFLKMAKAARIVIMTITIIVSMRVKPVFAVRSERLGVKGFFRELLTFIMFRFYHKLLHLTKYIVKSKTPGFLLPQE